jgi:hypothetical protein
VLFFNFALFSSKDFKVWYYHLSDDCIRVSFVTLAAAVDIVTVLIQSKVCFKNNSWSPTLRRSQIAGRNASSFKAHDGNSTATNGGML